MYENIELNLLTIQLTKTCNLNCKHCFLSGGGLGELPVESLEKIIQEALKYNIKEMALTGGEPLLHSRIYEILDLAGQYPLVRFGVLTNGTVLNEKIIEVIQRYDNIYVQISFDGTQKEIYEKNRGYGTFDRFWNGLELLAASKIKDKRTRTAVTLYNYKDLGNICNVVYQKGIRPSFLFVARLGNAEANWKELELSEIQKMKVNNVIKNFNKQHNVNYNLIYPPGKCVFTKNEERKSFNITAGGTVYTCDYLFDFPIGNIFTDDLKSIFQGPELQKIYDLVQERNQRMEGNGLCTRCEVRRECNLGCPAEAIIQSNENGCDTQCKFRRIFYACHVKNLC